jgi:CRP/FNR family transcriptional regulator, cyclic AMP receptor protein
MSEEMKYYYLKNIGLFETLPESAYRELIQLLKFKTVYRGEAIGYEDGSSSKIYFVVKGKIKITEGDDRGNELVKDILADGELFGDLGLDGRSYDDEVAEALTANTIIGYCNAADFRRVVQNNPSLAINFASRVNGKLKRLEDRHADLVFRDAKSRLIRFIKNWARTDGSRIGDKIILNNYLTHSDIAGFIATSRQSVNVLFNELRDAGMLHYNRKKIELNDPVIWN